MNNEQAHYMLEKEGEGTIQALTDGQEVKLIYKNKGRASTMIKLEMNADKLNYVRTVGNASIDSMEILNF